MSSYDAPLPHAPERPGHRLGWALLLDMLIIGILVVILSLAIPVIFLLGNTVKQGADLSSLSGMNEAQLLKLIGVPGLTILLVVQNLIFIAVPVIRTSVIRREPLRTIGFQADRPLRLIAFGIGLGILTLVANAGLGLFFQQFGVRQNQAEQYPLFPGDYAGQAVFFLGAAVMAPLGEEILFRGYIFNTLRRMWEHRSGGIIGAYLLSASPFALAHLFSATQGQIALIIPTLVMGLIFAWSVHRSNSLIPCILAHMINNSLAMLALVFCINNAELCRNI